MAASVRSRSPTPLTAGVHMGDLSAPVGGDRKMMGNSSALLHRASVMHTLQRPFKVFLEIGESPRERRRPGDENIVVVGACLPLAERPHGRAQTPFNPVAFDRAAHLFCDREAEPGRFGAGTGSRTVFRRHSRPRLQNERRRRTSCAAPNSQEVRSFLECDQRQSKPFSKARRFGPDGRPPGPKGHTLWLGGETLAALSPTARNNLDTARRLHPRAEAVPTLAHELAGLIGAFHRNNSVMPTIERHPADRCRHRTPILNGSRCL